MNADAEHTSKEYRLLPNLDNLPGEKSQTKLFDVDELVHEIRGPLSAALYALESPEHPRSAEIIHVSLEHLKQLLESITPIEKSETVIVDAIRDAILVSDFTGRVITNINIDSSLKSSCAPAHFRQLVVNLITNALKFSPLDKPVTVSVAHINGQVIIDVTDNGDGVSERDAKFIFDRGYRGKTAGNTKGTGIGLALTRRLAEVCGGSANLESTSPYGTTFRVSIPTYF
jgi:hypothetical protein